MKTIVGHALPTSVQNATHHELDIARTFSKKVLTEMGGLVKEVILFGETARSPGKGKDIDILIVIDDVTMQLTPELIQTYRVLLEKIVIATSPLLHVMTLKLSTFWEYVRAGEPVITNILRDGIALVGTGFFDPLQHLLRQGRIRPSPEAIWNYLNRAPHTLKNSDWHLLQATLDLYWAVIDTAHAALMTEGVIPTAPQHVAELFHEHLVKQRGLSARYSHVVDLFYHLSKKITRRELITIKGTDYEKYKHLAREFVTEVNRHTEKVLRERKE